MGLCRQVDERFRRYKSLQAFLDPAHDTLQLLEGKNPFATNKSSSNIGNTPVPTVTPAPSTAEVQQQEQDYRRQQLRKKGFDSTVYAAGGDTGGWHPGAGGTPQSSAQPQVRLG
jgi:hypothetical protein